MDAFGNLDPINMTKIDTASSLSSRQKSCNACVRGKRRCDKRTPRCTRCAAKGLDCVYHKMPPAQAGAPGSLEQHKAFSSGHSSGGSTPPEMAEVPDFDMGFDYESLGTETSPESMCQIPDQTPQQHHQHQHQPQQPPHHHQPPPQQRQQHSNPLHLGPGLDFDIVEFMNSASMPNAQTALHEPPAGNNGFFASLFDNNASSKMDIPPVPFSNALIQQPAAPPKRDVSLLVKASTCAGSIDPLQIHDHRNWMGHTVQILTNMHKTFAETRAAPFAHPRLWASQLPAPILSVFSAATAYTNRTPNNKAWIMRLLTDTAVSVHRDGERNADTPYDRLARVQALIILDTIRVFDGDITLRAAAESEVHVLMTWIEDLQKLTVTLEAEAMQHAQDLVGTSSVSDEGVHGTTANGMGLGGSTFPSRDRPPKSWDAWILLESARRTLLFSCAFVCMTKLLKNQEVSQEMWKDLTFTASRSLWEAPSSVEFYRAWKDKPQYFIRDFDFKDFWSYARPDDMDDFTRTMLMPQVGYDAIEHFMAEDTPSPVATTA